MSGGMIRCGGDEGRHLIRRCGAPSPRGEGEGRAAEVVGPYMGNGERGEAK